MSTTEKPPEVAAVVPSNTLGTVTTMSTDAEPRATPYIVLAKFGDDWRIQETIETTSQHVAIRRHLDGKAVSPKPADAYVAVPARSWQPVKPKTETVTKTTLEAL